MATVKVKLRLGCGTAALVLAILSGGPALAQTTPAEAKPDPGVKPKARTREAEIDSEKDIIVTGSNISGVKPVGGQQITLDRAAILATGKTTVADVVRTLPQLQSPSGSVVEQPTGGDSVSGQTNRGTALNIRGLGSNATLLLVDGHRISAAGTASSFTEANVVPLAALQRIEVLTDGASAIYGSDAIAGVVNYILRKDYEGLEVNARYNFGGFGDAWAVGGVGGTRWKLGDHPGNIIVTYEHSMQDPILRGRIARLRQDQRAYGGLDNRISQGSATPALNGNIIVATPDPNPFDNVGAPINPAFPIGGANTYYALPLNPAGAPLTLGSLTANAANVIDRSDYEDYQPLVRRDQVAAFFNQEIAPGISVYDEGFYNRRVTVTRTFLSQNASSNLTVTVPATLTNGQPNPNYIAGIPGVAPGAPITVQYNVLARVDPNGPRFVNDTPETSFSNTAGVRSDLWGNWKSDLYYTYSQNKTCGVCYIGTFINADQPPQTNALQAQINAGLINPFSTAPFTTTQLNAILGDNTQYAQNYSHDAVLHLNGSLFRLPGGAVRAALGGEYYFGIQKLQNGASRNADNAFVPDANARRSRTQYAVFGELYIPVIGHDMNVPLIDELTLDAAVRYDHYSDFGSTTNPRIGATWRINDDLSLRGNWGTSFRAPGLPELQAGVFSTVFNFDTFNNSGLAQFSGLGTVNTLYRVGGNENLGAETADTWSAGFDFTPRFVSGLRLSGTYYKVTYQDRLYGGLGQYIGAYLSSPAAAAITAPFITRINNPASCVNGNPSTYDPALVPFATGFLYGGLTAPCSIQAVFDARTVNASQTMQDGIDGNLNYTLLTDVGTFFLSANVTKILHNKVLVVAGLPSVDQLDIIGSPVSFRARGSIGYGRGPLNVSLFMNRVGGYLNNAPISDTTLVNGVYQQVARPNSQVPSWTTFDLNAGLSFDGRGRWGFLRNTRLSFTATNVFDKAPPIVFSSFNSSGSVDLFNHNANGRTLQLSLSRSF